MPPKKEKADAELPPHLCDKNASFRLPNGDRYSGEFQANFKTKLIYRQGRGTYSTWDGDRYTGDWENDALVKGSEVWVQFADGCEYRGLLAPNMDYVEGTYKFHDGCRMQARFGKQSVPLADGLVFTDAHGQVWDNQLEQQFLRIRLPQRFAQSGEGDKHEPSDD